MDENSGILKRKREENDGNYSKDESAEENYDEEFLMDAVQAGDLSLVKRVLEKGNVSMLMFEPVNSTPLEMAFSLGHMEIVDLIMEHYNAGKYDIDCKDGEGRTQLFGAFLNEDLELAKLLIKNGADVDTKDNDGDTPLELACGWGWDCLELVQLLIESGASVSDRAVHLACDYSSLEVVKLLIDNGGNGDARNGDDATPLHVACEYGDVELVKFLIQNDSDLSAKDRKSELPFDKAIDEGHLDVIKLLIDNGANAVCEANFGLTLLHVACLRDSLEVVEFLIEIGADVSARSERDGRTPLHYTGNIGILKLLIDKGACVNAKDDSGQTPLHRLCWFRQLEQVKLLFENGADIQAEDNEGRKPIHIACNKNESETVKFLIENGVDDVNVKDKNGLTPLHWTCKNMYLRVFKSIEVIKFLIEKGANLNAQDKDGKTPLYHACEQGFLLAAEFLVNRGADATLASSEGITPLVIASQRNHKEVAWFLVRQYPWLVL